MAGPATCPVIKAPLRHVREPSSSRRAQPPPPGGTGLRRSQTAPHSGRLRPRSAALCLRVLHRVPWRPGRPGEPGSQPGLDLAVGRWGPGWPGGQRSGFRVWAWSLGPRHPVPASARLQKNPLTLVFLIPPRLGTHAGGGGGWLLTPQETQKAGPCLATATPRLQAPLGATQPGSLSVSTPLCHLRREGRAGRSRGPDAQSSSWPGANETKSTETATNQSPSACDSEASPHLSAWGSFPGASLRFLSFRKNSRPQHSQDSRRGLRSRNSTMRTSGQVGDEQTGGGVRLTRTCSASPVHAATHPCTWCLTRARGGPVSGSTPPPQAALASSVHV